jgi:uncharacterized HhH-GPD family protein
MAVGTLRITGDPDADRLLNTDGTALLVGMLLDQQVPMEWAFTGPARLRARLGHLDAARIAAMDVDALVAVCAATPAVHRFPAAMGRRIHELCVVVADRYRGDGARVWRGARSAAGLYERLRELPGFGDEKAKILVAVLAKRFGVRPRGWEAVAAPFSDDQPRTVADIDSPEALARVREWKRATKAAGLDKQDRPRRSTRQPVTASGGSRPERLRQGHHAATDTSAAPSSTASVRAGHSSDGRS